MAVIKLAEDAPEGAEKVYLANDVIDVSGGSVETDEYSVISNARANPFLVVEDVEPKEVEQPEVSEETQPHATPDPSSTPDPVNPEPKRVRKS